MSNFVCVDVLHYDRGDVGTAGPVVHIVAHLLPLSLSLLALDFLHGAVRVYLKDVVCMRGGIIGRRRACMCQYGQRARAAFVCFSLR